MPEKRLTYKDSGVDKQAGYQSVSLMKNWVKKTFTPGVISDLGGFGGMFAIDKHAYHQPVLVSGTDGVGTKLMVAFMADRHDTIGEDCVAMCVNDVLCQGAKPLFFLDYISTGKIEPEKIAQIVKGIAKGCIKAHSALIGGETAEMPGLYAENEYDLAGFSVGIVDKHKIINGADIKPGDVLIALPSNGLHSNGFSLVRKLFFEIEKMTVEKHIPELGHSLAEELLRPTRIYVEPVYELIEKFEIKGISHITGGGFYENIPRMIPTGLTARISCREIEKQPVFQLIQKLGNIETREMYSTFNMGAGMVLALAKKQAQQALSFLNQKNEKAFVLGEIIQGTELEIFET